MGKGKFVSLLAIIEIPVTPPSINPFGIKKSSKPNQAEKIPAVIKKREPIFIQAVRGACMESFAIL